ncbi:MAG: shikimate dehydrogenase, partial [Acidimicrobiales bacterium]|nr:shikimate dehydrogenase [Acidimicrobiales bacterium]
MIGSPVRHSLSPAIHNAAFEASGLDWAYVAFEVAPGQGEDAVRAIGPLGIAGLSVTMPHKQAAWRAVDQRTRSAEWLGAVNCVVSTDGRLVGHNTDGAGFVRGLAHDAGFELAGRSALVLGAGGAARAVIAALADAGAADVAVWNRTASKAADAATLAGSNGRTIPAPDPGGFDLVVNATPCGMTGDISLPCSVDAMSDDQVAVDLVYEPAETPWLAALRARGVAAFGGLSMLVFQ